MRERFSRYARHESDVHTYACTIKCGINTHERVGSGGSLQSARGLCDRGMERERERDNVHPTPLDDARRVTR